MIATGVLLTGGCPHAAQVQARCAAVLAVGPAPVTEEERAAARYGLTDLLDDLTHAQDPGERTVIVATAWTTAAQQALTLGGHRVGSGKWLLRGAAGDGPRVGRALVGRPWRRRGDRGVRAGGA